VNTRRGWEIVIVGFFFRNEVAVPADRERPRLGSKPGSRVSVVFPDLELVYLTLTLSIPSVK
jgi:hypothetical protein